MLVKIVKPLSTTFTVGIVAQFLETSTRGDFCLTIDKIDSNLTIRKITEFFGYAYRSHVKKISAGAESSIDAWGQVVERVIDTGNSAFETWWKGFYGVVDEYTDADEYYTRKAFAYYGWKAQVRRYATATDELLRDTT